MKQGLTVIPVLNKIDLPTADIERAKEEIEAVIGIDAEDAIPISAKTGLNVTDVLEAIVARIPPPRPRDTDKLQALIIDSWFDNYLGVVSLVRVMQGEIKPKDKVLVMSTGRWHEVDQVGVFTPKRLVKSKLGGGEVGWVTASIKEVHGAPVGDTLTLNADPAPHPLPGFQKVQPRVFSGLFPVNADALHFEPESSEAMGFGFRCGFLGLLHMDIIQERLEREYDLDLIGTAPTVIYEVLQTDGSILDLDNPAKLPPNQNIQEIREPIIVANILTPQEYVGNVIKLCEEKRGVQRSINYMANQVQISYELPLAEVVLDFFDRLKSVSRGYASMDYHFERFQVAPLVRLDILINGERVDALSLILHRSIADRRGRDLVERMKELIPRQQFDVAIQGGQMLWRRRFAQAQVAGETEGRQEAHETGRSRRYPAGGFSCHPAIGQQMSMRRVRGLLQRILNEF